MATEIERKFLVNKDLLPMKIDVSYFIRQGYISLKNPTIRIRTIDEKVGKLTIKGPGTISKKEYEFYIPYFIAAFILKFLTLKIEKWRHCIKTPTHTWEVDEFRSHLNGLWVAEIELKSVNEYFPKPLWLMNEVTEDSRYSNAKLAKHGIPKQKRKQYD